MSRIHEALKKAEQERAAVSRPESGARPIESTKPGPVTPAGAQSEVSATIATPPLHGNDRRSVSLAIESLLKLCPRVQWKPDSQKLLFLSSQNHRAGTEEFRTLRSRLYQIREKDFVRTVLVTSALPGEGKTFVAANLAQVIVRQHERRALLIDTDLRLPQLHALLGARKAPGLSDYLLGEADETAITQRGPNDNLFFIPAGKEVANPVELLSNGRLGNLIDHLAPVFDWIILDSPPIVLVSDASLLAKYSEGVLIVARAAVTPFDMAQKARNEFHGKRVLGVVLNRADVGARYGYYYYKPYGHTAKKGGKG